MSTGPAEQNNTAGGPQPLIALLGFCVGCRPPSVGNGCAEPPKAMGSSWREPALHDIAGKANDHVVLIRFSVNRNRAKCGLLDLHRDLLLIRLSSTTQ